MMRVLPALALLSILVAGCSIPLHVRTVNMQGYSVSDPDDSPASGMLATSLHAADALLANGRDRLGWPARIVTTSLVNLARLEETSAFGRLVGHQVASRMAEQGYPVVETKLRQTMAMKPAQGERMLSRHTAQVMQGQFNATAVVLGTYETTPDEVYVSLRLTRLEDQSVLGAYEYVLPVAGPVKRLLLPQADNSAWMSHAFRPRVDQPMVMSWANTGAGATPAPAKRMAAPNRVPGPTVVGTAKNGDMPSNFPALQPPATGAVH